MEGVPRMPMLEVEVKHNSLDYSSLDWAGIPAEDVHEVVQQQVTETIKKHIREEYHDDPEKFNDAIEKLVEIQSAAYKAILAPDFEGCNTLKKYYGQLHYMQSRFPFKGDEGLKVTFSWQDAFTGILTIHESFAFEQTAILYNIGAIHSILGASDSRITEEGIRISCVHFQCAAGLFTYIAEHFDTTLSPDISQAMLKLLINTMLAQGQECLLEKSMQDNRKHSIVSKISQQVVDYYKLCIQSLDNRESENILGSSAYKSWRRMIGFKVSYYSAITKYFTGNNALDQDKYGQSVAYFGSAVGHLTELAKLLKSFPKETRVKVDEALKFTADVLNGKYNSAVKDNNYVYNDRVPDASTLPEVKGASLVKALPFEPANEQLTGPDIFAKLVPMEAHLAASSYSEEKAKLLRSVVEKIDAKNEVLAQYNSSIELDPQKLIDPNEPSKLNQSLIEKCAQFSVDQTPISDLKEATENLTEVYNELDTVLNNIMTIVENEETEDMKLQDAAGKDAFSTQEDVEGIKKELSVYTELHQKASKMNEDLQTACRLHIENMKTVSAGIDSVKDELQLTDIKELTTEDDRNDIELVRKLCDKVVEMKEQRSNLLQQLRQQMDSDDVTSTLVTRHGIDQEELFAEELKKYDSLIDTIGKNLSAQDNILNAVTEANARYTNIRKTVEKEKERVQKRTTTLVGSCEAVPDMLKKCTDGKKFFGDIATKAKDLYERATEFRNENETKRKKIYKKIEEKKKPPPRPVAPKPKLSAPKKPSVPTSLAPSGPLPQGGVLSPDVLAKMMAEDEDELLNDPEFLQFLQKQGDLQLMPPLPGGAMSYQPPGSSLSGPLSRHPQRMPPGPGLPSPTYPVASTPGILPGQATSYHQAPPRPAPQPTPPQDMMSPQAHAGQNFHYQASNAPHPGPQPTSPQAPPPHMGAQSSQYQPSNIPSRPAPQPTPPQVMSSQPHVGPTPMGRQPSNYRTPQMLSHSQPTPPQSHMTQAPMGQYVPRPSPSPSPVAIHPHHSDSTPFSGSYHLQGTTMMPHGAMSSAPPQQIAPTHGIAPMPYSMASTPQISTHTPPSGVMAQSMSPHQNASMTSVAPPGVTPMPQHVMATPQNFSSQSVHVGQTQMHHAPQQDAPTRPPMQGPQVVYSPQPATQQVIASSYKHNQSHQMGHNLGPNMGAQYSQSDPVIHMRHQPQIAPMNPPQQTQPQFPQPAQHPQNVSQSYSSPAPPQQTPRALNPQQFQQPPSHPSNQYYPPQFQVQNTNQPLEQPMTRPPAPSQPQGQINPQQFQYQQQGSQNPPNVPQYQNPLTYSMHGQSQPHAPGQGTPILQQVNTLNQQPSYSGHPLPAPGTNQNVPPSGTNIPFQNQGQSSTNQISLQQHMVPATMSASMPQLSQPQVPQQPAPNMARNFAPMPTQQQQSYQPLVSAPQQHSTRPPVPNNALARNFGPMSGPPQQQNYAPQNAPNQQGTPQRFQQPTSNFTRAPGPQHQQQNFAPQTALNQQQNSQRFQAPKVSQDFNSTPGPLGQQQNFTPQTNPTQQQASNAITPTPTSIPPGQQQNYLPQTARNPQQNSQRYQAPDTVQNPTSGPTLQNPSSQLPPASQHSIVKPQGTNPPQQPLPNNNPGQNFVSNQGPRLSYPSTTQQALQNNTSVQRYGAPGPGQQPAQNNIVSQNFGSSQGPRPSYPNTTQQLPQNNTPPQRFCGPVPGPTSQPTPNESYTFKSRPHPGKYMTTPSNENSPKHRPKEAPSSVSTQTLEILTPIPVQAQSSPKPPLSSQPSSDLAGLILTPTRSQSTSADELLLTTPEIGINLVKDTNQHVLVPTKVDEDSDKMVVRPVEGLPYMDEADLMKFKNETAKFQTKVANLLQKHENESLCELDKEWKHLSEAQEKHSRQLSTAIARCSSYKNRFQDVVPFDQSRVVLKQAKDDYINASVIDGVSPYCPRFIATQSPLPNTISDFWTMVYEQQINIIVMLVNIKDVPRKCPMYWPPERTVPQQHGPLTVSFTTSKTHGDLYIERTFTVRHKNQSLAMSVTQLQYIAWPEHRFPSSASDLLQFVQVVRSYHSSQRNLQWPILVHCESGVGRTGVFCAFYTGINEINAGMGIMGVVDIVTKMRQKRKYMVQEKAQLKFVYDVILYHAIDVLKQRKVVLIDEIKPMPTPVQPHPNPVNPVQNSGNFDIFSAQSALSSIQAKVEKMTIKSESERMHSQEIPAPMAQGDTKSCSSIPDSVNFSLVNPLPPRPSTSEPHPKYTDNNDPASKLGDMSDLVQGTIALPPFEQPSTPTIITPQQQLIPQPDVVESCNSPMKPESLPDSFSRDSASPSSLIESLTPESFTLNTDDDVKKKQRITKEDFYKPTPGINSEKDPNDPFSGLDPLWGLRK